MRTFRAKMRSGGHSARHCEVRNVDCRLLLVGRREEVECYQEEAAAAPITMSGSSQCGSESRERSSVWQDPKKRSKRICKLAATDPFEAGFTLFPAEIRRCE